MAGRYAGLIQVAKHGNARQIGSDVERTLKPAPDRQFSSHLVYEDEPHPAAPFGGDGAYMIVAIDSDILSQHVGDFGRNSVCSIVIDDTRIWVLNPKETACSYRPKTDGMPPLRYPDPASRPVTGPGLCCRRASRHLQADVQGEGQNDHASMSHDGGLDYKK